MLKVDAGFNLNTVRLDGSHCASMAQFQTAQLKMSLEFLRDEIQSKASEKTDMALLELTPLCREYAELSEVYEHLFSLETLHKQAQGKK